MVSFRLKLWEKTLDINFLHFYYLIFSWVSFILSLGTEVLGVWLFLKQCITEGEISKAYV